MAALGWLALGVVIGFWAFAMYAADRQIDRHYYDDLPEDEIEKERREWM